ncbi:MAG: alkane 1-monooxygenase [Saprospiraceae bacterium]|nr:alkane 1-monooxygenase [Saprospiraceae bacterium]
MRDVKYLAAYLVPLSAALGLAYKGPWAWLTLALVFGILPVVEMFTPQSTLNIPPEEEDTRGKRLFFDLLLYLNAPIIYSLTGWYLWLTAYHSLTWAEWIGLTGGMGVVLGACGINVAHELGHRSNKMEQLLAQIMLLPSLYQHFFVEHNRGHHKNVATDADPASARQNESLFHFWIRSVLGSWRNAWKLEQERLYRKGLRAGSWQNALVRYSLIQGCWLIGIAAFLGWKALAGAIGIAIGSFLLLETVNYIEHYGLRRRLLPSGLPEPVSPKHSWNSNHALGRIFLYELTRHSDHHYKATRKYQILRHMEESPQLPFGYPTSIVIALAPPLWFWVMNKRLPVN